MGREPRSLSYFFPPVLQEEKPQRRRMCVVLLHERGKLSGEMHLLSFEFRRLLSIFYSRDRAERRTRIFINPARRPFPSSPSLKFMWQEANERETKFASCFPFSKPHPRGFDLSRIILSNATNIFFLQYVQGTEE